MDAVDSGRKALIMKVLGLLLGQPRYWWAYASVRASLFTAILPNLCLSLWCSYWVQCGQPPRLSSPSLLLCPLFVYIILEMPMNIGLAGCFHLRGCMLSLPTFHPTFLPTFLPTFRVFFTEFSSV